MQHLIQEDHNHRCLFAIYLFTISVGSVLLYETLVHYAVLVVLVVVAVGLYQETYQSVLATLCTSIMASAIVVYVNSRYWWGTPERTRGPTAGTHNPLRPPSWKVWLHHLNFSVLWKSYKARIRKFSRDEPIQRAKLLETIPALRIHQPRALPGNVFFNNSMQHFMEPLVVSASVGPLGFFILGSFVHETGISTGLLAGFVTWLGLYLFVTVAHRPYFSVDKAILLKYDKRRRTTLCVVVLAFAIQWIDFEQRFSPCGELILVFISFCSNIVWVFFSS